MSDRQALRSEWLKSIAPQYGLKLDSEEVASADASFRHYYRLQGDKGKSYIVMDAPPEQESIESFVKVTHLFESAHLNVPTIYEENAQHGFLLLKDLGKNTYLDVLNEDNAREFFEKAIDALIQWQLISKPGVLPEYDRAVLSREINLFPEWYISVHRKMTLDDRQTALMKMCFERILKNNLAQEKVFVHRDYMPRNLMATSENVPGILDYQDALYGPIAYDIASLMRDAFISWGEVFVIDMTIRYWEKARKVGLPVPADFGLFWRDVEWMGIQRHLKVLGIFARINYRDGKPKYLADTPRFIGYVRETANRYDELKPLLYLMDQIENSVPKFGYTF